MAAMVLIAALPVTAGARDRNKDRIPDRWERQHGLSLKVNQARRDQDHDALRNRAEFQSRMDPHDPDSDDDGVDDGDEGAGVIGSFDESTGKLRIDLFNGDTVIGLVTDETEIVCDNGDDHGDEDGDDGSGGEEGEYDDGEEGDFDDGEDEGDLDEGEGDFDEGEGIEDYIENSGDRRNSDLSDDEGDYEDEWDEWEDEVDDECKCSTDALSVGTVVQEAELEVGSGGAVWVQVELLTP